MQRKINLLLVLFSIIGGAVGFAVGELILHSLLHTLPTFVVIGIYFGSLAFFIGLFCLIAEMIAPRLNGSSWRQRYAGTSWKLLVPVTLVLLFVIGLALEALYHINIGGARPVKDIVLVIDNSGSMKETDPNQDRYSAAKRLIQKMDSDNQLAVLVFHDQVEVIQPFTEVNTQVAKDEVAAKIDALEQTDGGTNIALALDEAMNQIQAKGTAQRGTMVILLSDGFSEVDTNQVLAKYEQQHVAINTIGLSLVNPKGTSLLQQIADRTSGQYYDVSKADDLSLVFQKIYDNLGNRTLVTERSDNTKDNAYYMILRIIALLLIGTGIGLSLGLVFDNRHLARSFMIGGSVAGLLAGLLLEFGLSGHPFADGLTRFIAALLLAGVIGLFTWIIPIQEHQRLRQDRHRDMRAGRSSHGFDNRSRDQRNKGF
ncbi:vWA domain-containing protein [Paenibacillus guangzhouensis]|uniref:vWA domain-containing protein n=1 Tax=Paenibacillus guangzhouensis TaxID=1473112 RepID=UPI001266B373|nr:vWA domain-containing protein [Paenibacillus guangzhouensis]